MNHPSDPGRFYPQPPGPPGGHGPAPHAPYPGGYQQPAAMPGHSQQYYGPAPPGGYPGPAFGPAPAEWGARFAAYLIDGLIATVLYFVVSLAGGFGTLALLLAVSPQTAESPAVGVTLVLFWAVAGLFAAFCYFWLPHARSGQTLGKRMLSIKLVSIDTGLPPSKGASAGRRCIFIAMAFVPFGQLLDCLWPLWDEPYRQAVHDKAAKTRVIRV